MNAYVRLIEVVQSTSSQRKGNVWKIINTYLARQITIICSNMDTVSINYLVDLLKL